MNNKKLMLVLLVLVGIYGLSQVFSSEKDRSFNSDLIQLDTAAVNSLVLNTKADGFETVKLQKENGNWLISKNNFTTKASSNAVNNLFNSLTTIKAKRIVAKNPDKWVDYEVEEGKGSRIQVFENGTVKEDFILGRFNFNQQTRSATSYIRLNNENEVYAIDGMTTMGLTQNFDAFRNKQLVSVNTNDLKIIRIEDNNSENSLELKKLNNTWSIDENPVDSTKIAEFTKGLANLAGAEFINDFDELKANELLFQQLTITADNLIEPISIQCYQDTARAKPFIIHSSQNPDAYFASDAAGIYARLYKKMEDFVE